MFNELNNRLNNLIAEAQDDNAHEYVLADLKYTIQYDKDKMYSKVVPQVDNLNYKLNKLNAKSIEDIVSNNTETKDLRFKYMDSSCISYDNKTGIIKSTKPINIVDSQNKAGHLMFQMTVWTHPTGI